MEEETTSLNKEIQNLLENVDNSAIGGRKSWRTYARLVLPHVGLVIFVCFYALLGAWIFYSIESPHEDRLKVQGIRRVQELRRQLVKEMLERKSTDFQSNWIENTENQLRKFGEDLFRSYKEQYVRFEDVRLTTLNATKSSNSTSNQPAQPVVVAQMDPRFRRHFSKSRSEGKMWTPSSALFFAATTMATIGYGNIVPMTNQGRIACIIFALFGAPLAIITIGDLGKFLSECTIWMYRRTKDKSRLFHFQFCQYWMAHRKRRRRQLKENFISDELAMDGNLEMGSQDGERDAEEQLKEKSTGDMEQQKEMDKRRMDEAERERRMNEWEEEEKLETEVPVLVVFAILLFYIAFGGVLFAFLESWTYMDAFYYCFVSLTTIGFGDLVPDRHEYIVLMLLYLGIGLAVTTMCIDLVGVQYIQKIHYFGRKFKGTDIMKILKRQRMMERRLAMGEGKEFIEFVMIKQQEREALSLPSKAFVQPGVVHLASQLFGHEPQEEEKISLRSEAEWPMEELIVQDIIPSNELALAQSLKIPEILEPSPLVRRLSSPTVSPSSESERSIMYKRLQSGRINSWCESGPSISMNSALSTEPSVQQREEFYANYRTPEPSPTSFAFSFPPPSPDLWKIADAARNSRRLASCPALPPYPEETVSQFPPRLWRKWRTLASPSRAFHELLRFSKRCVVVVLPFQSLSRRFSQAQSWESGGNNHRPRLGTNGLDVGENWGEEAAAESIHHLDVLKRRVSFFENQAEILQAPKAPPLRFISQPVWYYRRRRSLHQQQEGPLTLPSASTHSVSEQSNPTTVPSISQKATLPLEAYQPILKRKRRERLARKFDPLLRFDWLALSPRIAVTEESGRPATMEEISERAQELLKMDDLPKQLATEHPIYQHLANLESVTEFGSTSQFDQQSQSGTLSSRPLIGRGERFSLESLALSLKAARRWKERTKKRESISSQGQGPSTSKILLPQMKWLMKSPRRTSLGGGQLANLSKELSFGNGQKFKEIVEEKRMDTGLKKIELNTVKQYSPAQQRSSIVGERNANPEATSSGQRRQMSIDIGGKKMPSPIRTRQRASVAEERRMGTGGARGSLIPSGNELRQKMPTKTSKETIRKGETEIKQQQQQRKGTESSKKEEANTSSGK